MRYLIAGAHGSGTTWVYNVIRQYMEDVRMKHIGGWIEQMPPSDMMDRLTSNYWVLKTHGFPNIQSMAERTGARIFRVWRPREECVASIVRRLGIPPAEAEALVARDIDNMKELHPTLTVNYHADHLGEEVGVYRVLQLAGFIADVIHIESIADRFSKEAVRNFQKSIREGAPGVVKDERGILYDARTLLQQNHVG